jgi:hypothetical protein
MTKLIPRTILTAMFVVLLLSLMTTITPVSAQPQPARFPVTRWCQDRSRSMEVKGKGSAFGIHVWHPILQGRFKICNERMMEVQAGPYNLFLQVTGPYQCFVRSNIPYAPFNRLPPSGIYMDCYSFNARNTSDAEYGSGRSNGVGVVLLTSKFGLPYDIRIIPRNQDRMRIDFLNLYADAANDRNRTEFVELDVNEP